MSYVRNNDMMLESDMPCNVAECRANPLIFL
nr:MAG TPA: hypothetical protein [Caudoviricetes sp.]